MANEKLVTLEQLSIIKGYIDNKDAAAIKSAEYEDNTIKLYNTADKSGDPLATLDLSKEIAIEYATDEEVQALFSD